MTQTEALTILKTGKNVFVTGPAGSGKTHVLDQYIKYLRSHNVSIGITASTGIAATHIGGVTIHSWSGIGIKDSLKDYDLAEIADRKQVKKKIESAKVLIIDEVSMLHHFRLDMVDQVTKRMRKSDKPFGGLQVVLCGDFFQLPPIVRDGGSSASFICESKSWKEGNFTVCYLGDNYRQINDESRAILDEIRSGDVSEKSYELLMSRRVGNGCKVGEGQVVSDITGDDKNGDDISTKLFTHNTDVDAMNDAELAKMDGYETTYEMSTKGKKPLVEALKRSCLAPEKLRLKEGARVICVKNNFEEGYVNGTLGVVVSCGFGTDPMIRTAPSRDFPLGRLITIAQAEWTIDDDDKVLAKVTQYPLRLAWAITVHKSQGMSLDSVEVDLSKSFEPGMGYVALSRVRTLAGLKILGMNDMALKVNPFVLQYDGYLKELSAKAESVIQHTDQKDIEREHAQFLARAAPLHSMKSDKNTAYKFPKEGNSSKKKKSKWKNWGKW